MARLGAGAVVTIALLGACSVSTNETLDNDKGEKAIATLLQEKTGAAVGDVNCPERDVKQGDVFECTAQLDGQPVRLQITQRDDEGNVDMKQAQAIIDLKQAVAFVQGEVEKAQGKSVTADCGPGNYLVKDPGTTFDCQITPTPRGTAGRVVVTVNDVDGKVDLRLI